MPGGMFPFPDSFVEIEGSGGLNFTESSLTGTRMAMVDYYDLPAAVWACLGLILVDPSTGEWVRIAADQWPGIPFLYATSLEAEPLGQMQPSDWNAGAIYSHYRVTVNYTIPDWREPDDQDDNSPEDETYLIQSLDYSVDVATVPVKVTDTNYDGKQITRTTKKHIRLPLCRYTATRPKVIRPDWNDINLNIGKINSNVIMGGLPGTVLFDGAKADREVSSYGERAWRETREYLYNPHGWNNVLHPETLKWVPANSEDGGTELPYKVTVLKLPGA